jgi:mRNA interferase MazF
MQRGEIWWAMIPPPAGPHPVLLVSRDESYARRTQVIVALITSRRRQIPVEVPLGMADGMPKDCVINLDTIANIPKSLLASRLTVLTPEKVKEVDASLHFALGLE